VETAFFTNSIYIVIHDIPYWKVNVYSGLAKWRNTGKQDYRSEWRISIKKFLATIFLILLLIFLILTALNVLPNHYLVPQDPSDSSSNPTDGSTNENVEGIDETIRHINVVPEADFGTITILTACLAAFAVYKFSKKS
jgi:hypothetical protein